MPWAEADVKLSGGEKAGADGHRKDIWIYVNPNPGTTPPSLLLRDDILASAVSGIPCLNLKHGTTPMEATTVGPFYRDDLVPEVGRFPFPIFTTGLTRTSVTMGGGRRLLCQCRYLPAADAR